MYVRGYLQDSENGRVVTIGLDMARRTKKKRDRDRYKRLQQDVQRETRKAHKQYMEDVVSDGENRNKFWSYIKSKGQEFSGVAPLKNGVVAIIRQSDSPTVR